MSEERRTLSYFWSRRRQGESVYVRSSKGVNLKVISKSEAGFICSDGKGMKLFIPTYDERPVWTKGTPF